MSRTQPLSPTLAPSAGSSSAQATERPVLPRSLRTAEESLLSAESGSEEVLELLRELVETNQVGKARQLTREAVRRFPENERIRLAKRVLNDGKATPNPHVQPTAAAEFEWLDDPPEEARGKWVALVGGELVAMADSVDELMADLRTRNLDQIPLVHHLAS